MADIQHDVGGDLVIGSSGDLATVDGSEANLQAILHRLLTAPGAYVWHMTYGAGLPSSVGSVVSGQQITAIIRSQLRRETAVAKTPPPAVSIATTANGLTIATITYVDDTTRTQVSRDIALER